MTSILRFKAAALVAVVVLGFGAAVPRANAAQYDVILEWNQQLASNLPSTAGLFTFVYGLWRPVTAIQRAGEDMNDATVGDPAWTPLLATPPYPAYSSNMTCIGVSAARALARGFRSDAAAFNVTWPGTGGNANVTRSYTTFSRLAEEQALSRLYGGIHFTFDLTSSQTSCTHVADYIADHYMRPRPFGFFH